MSTDQPVFDYSVPLLPVVDLAATLAWYRDKLGFEVIKVDKDPNLPDPDHAYAVLRRGGAEVHLQAQFAKDCPAGRQIQVRFQMRGVDAYFEELRAAGAVPEGKAPRDTDWGTREFGFYDPDGVGLHFYEDL